MDRRLLRINIEELDGGDVPSAYYWNGKLFTGITFELHPNGQLAGEYEMENGDFSGRIREWYPSGSPKSEGYEKYGHVHNWTREWYENGRLKYEHVYENGVCVRKNVWNKEGELIVTTQAAE